MKTKKLLATALAGLIVVAGAAGCAGRDNMSDIKPPVYEKGKEFMIGAWDSPMETRADYQLAKDMGLTHMFVDYGGLAGQSVRGSKGFLELLELMDELGLKAFLRTPASVFEEALQEETDYSKYPAVAAINWRDEPYYTDLPNMARAAERHMELYPDNSPAFFINHNPYYEETGDHNNVIFGGLTWEEFLEYYIETVCSKITAGRNILSYDYYPLMAQRGVYRMRTSWLPSIATLTKLAKEHDMDTHVFIQATKHFEYYPEMTTEDLRFQFAVYMAFGISDFSYFQYCDSAAANFDEGMVERYVSASPRPLYYRAQTVNMELKALQHIYLSFDYLGTMPVRGDDWAEQELFYQQNMIFEGIGSIPFVKEVSAEHNAIIGQFKDKKNDVNGLMVTNFTQPNEELSNTVKIKFDNAKKVAVYTKGTEKIYVLKDNVFEYKLEAGQGAFMIPLA